jgi:hypothetical protein
MEEYQNWHDFFKAKLAQYDGDYERDEELLNVLECIMHEGGFTLEKE